MPQPATTSELLLAQAVDLLTEVRDLLREGPASTTTRTEPAASPAPTPAAAESRPTGPRRRSSTTTTRPK